MKLLYDVYWDCEGGRNFEIPEICSNTVIILNYNIFYVGK